MANVILTVQAKNYEDVTAYSQIFDTTLMVDVIDNPTSNYSGNGSYFTYASETSDNDVYVVSEDLTEIATAADGAIKKAEVTLTSAQILALNTTPIDIVAAPGAGKAILPISGYAYVDFGTAAYATNTDIDIVDATAPTVSLFTAATVLAATADEYAYLRETAATAAIITANSALQVTEVTGDPVTGDGTCKVVVYYQEVTL